LTEAIAQSLGIDTARAEERKRAIGFGGAGETRRDALIDGLASLLATARATSRTEIHRLVMVGSGSRVPGLAEAIERATGYAVRPATLDADVSDRVPPDVLRAAAPDWSLAYGLSTWMTAS
jgi:cell division ATPase FtsA